ncbi:MAG TPA: molybdopterin molybdotransferase MoeA [Acidobacteriota bacterium]|nr:molybdopterin molybdotransferase MoeA [Acidobacteriota bacterium]
MILLDEAFSRLDAALEGRRLRRERVRLDEARGRFLDADVASLLDLPPFGRSAVDGYALLEGDYDRGRYRILETVAAGHPGRAKLEPGTTVKVMTGAPVPAGTGKVVMLEDAAEHDGFVQIHKVPKGLNFSRRAEDVRAGQVVLTKGQRLGPLEIANLVACGITEVDVVVPPSLYLISTGDEIVDSPKELQLGKIMNSNGPLLARLAEEHQLPVLGCASVRDDEAALELELAGAIEKADIVVVSGGVSVGDYDFVPRILERLGMTVHFNRLAFKPGKPTTFATGPNAVLFGLPGNPVAVYVMFHLMVLRGVARLSGAPIAPLRFMVPLASDFRRRATARMEYVPARISAEGRLERIEYHGSAHLIALMQADGFFEVPVGVDHIPAGEPVPFRLIR